MGIDDYLCKIDHISSASPEPILWFLSCRRKKGTPPAGFYLNHCNRVYFQEDCLPLSAFNISRWREADSLPYSKIGTRYI